MDNYMQFGEHYRQLCQVNSPAQLWMVTDQVMRQHPLYQDGKSPDSILASANSVVLYGAGRFSKAVIDAWKIKGEARLVYCVDSDPQKWGTLVGDTPVLNPRVLFEDKNRPLVVIAAMITHEIERTLDEQRIPFLYAERDGSVSFFPGHWLHRHQSKFDRVYSSLSDDQSRYVLMAAAKARMFQQYHFPMQGNLFLRDVSTFPQYFCEEIFTFSDGELFIDCGAFDGDTLVAFFSLMQRLGITQSQAIAFEVDKGNVKRISRTLERYALDDVKIISAAVGEDNINSDASMYHSCRETVNSYDVQVVTLDLVLDGVVPTFIKMDIEGAELDALMGARQTISKFRPKLAVCIYHLTWHLLDIPLCIMDNFPDYGIFIRHHAPGSLWETVCYADPR